MRSLLYSLKSVSNKTVLSIDTTGLIVSETHLSIQVSLPTGLTTISKFDYLNKGKVYNDGKVFFLVCNKHFERDNAFNILMQYTIDTYKTKIAQNQIKPDNIEKFERWIEKLETELFAA